MPQLGFKDRFGDDVESGAKETSIRLPRADRRDPKVGDVLYLFVGLRTKNCRRLGTAECIAVHNIVLGRGGARLAGLWLNQGGKRMLAVLDGFGTFAELLDCFEEMHGLPFRGLLIHWRLLPADDPRHLAALERDRKRRAARSGEHGDLRAAARVLGAAGVTVSTAARRLADGLGWLAGGTG